MSSIGFDGCLLFARSSVELERRATLAPRPLSLSLSVCPCLSTDQLTLTANVPFSACCAMAISFWKEEEVGGGGDLKGTRN